MEEKYTFGLYAVAVVLGLFGGLIGAGFNQANKRVAKVGDL